MTLSIDELRKKQQKFKEKLENAGNQPTTSGNIFPFSNLKPNDNVRVRFIKDADDDNPVFWRERFIRTFKFNTIKQADGTIKEIVTYVDIPAFNEKFDELLLSEPPAEYRYESKDDVIQQKIKGYWDAGEEGRLLYNRFRRKKQYVSQGFVRSEGYEKNKLYRFYLNPEMYELVKSFLDDTEFADYPTNPQDGFDFIINVSQKSYTDKNGEAKKGNDYKTSKWARSSSSLTQEEIASLNEVPPYDLKDFVMKRPTEEENEILLEMFEANINDEPYDVLKWKKHYPPNNVFFTSEGMIKENGSESKPTELPVREVVSTSKVETSTPSTSVADLLKSLDANALKEVTKAVEDSSTKETSEKDKVTTVTGNNQQEVISDLMAKLGIAK